MSGNSITSLFSVDGLVAVVTGGGSGLGLYAARALDANGAKAVYIVGRREETLKEAAMTAKNGNIIPAVCDVTDKEALAALAERVRQEQGYINLLFANAGVMGPLSRDDLQITAAEDPEGNLDVKKVQAALWKPETAAFTKALENNITGTYFTAIAFLDLLDAGNKASNVAQDSQIITTSSIAGVSRRLSQSFAYSASKAAITHLTKMMCTFFAQSGLRIRCNGITPGLYATEMTGATVHKMARLDDEDSRSSWPDARIMPKELSPSCRTGTEKDFAGVMLFMASKAGAYLNGETLLTDGGSLSQFPSVY